MEQLALLLVGRPLTEEEEAWLLSCVAPQKRARLSRMPNDAARQQHLLADVLARWMAGRRVGVSPVDLQIDLAPGGKPFLTDYPAVQYNVAHTQGGVLCAVSDHPVGVDMETMRLVPERVWNRWFTKEEQGWAGNDPLRQITLWTRKEAAAKWHGGGLAAVRRENTRQTDWMARLTSGQVGDLVWSVCQEPRWSTEPVILTMAEWLKQLHAVTG